MSVDASKPLETGGRRRAGAGPDLSMLEVALEFRSRGRPLRRDRVRILVDRSSGRAVPVSGDVLYAYDVLELESSLLDAAAGATVVVPDAPSGAPTCARLWTDCEIDETPGALRLTAGHVGRSLETLVLGEAPDGGLDLSATFDVESADGACRSLQGRYRIDAVRRMRAN